MYKGSSLEGVIHKFCYIFRAILWHTQWKLLENPKKSGEGLKNLTFDKTSFMDEPWKSSRQYKSNSPSPISAAAGSPNRTNSASQHVPKSSSNNFKSPVFVVMKWTLKPKKPENCIRKFFILEFHDRLKLGNGKLKLTCAHSTTSQIEALFPATPSMRLILHDRHSDSCLHYSFYSSPAKNGENFYLLSFQQITYKMKNYIFLFLSSYF